MTHCTRQVSRRRVLQTALTVAGAVLTGTRASAGPALTPLQTLGPFYPVSRPLDQDGDLTAVSGQTGRAQGRILHLSGRVLDPDGKPVRNARIEIWQANTHGRYAHPADASPAPLDPNFQGFGVQLTDEEGQYRFKTIKPAPYPINPMNPDAIRTPHIHVDVAGANTRLVSQVYFPGEALNATDLVMAELSAAEQAAATGVLLPPGADMEPDALVMHWDIVLLAG